MANIKIPPYHIIFKICSFNLNMYDTINRKDQVGTIINYITSNIYDIPIDIVCLSGIKEKLVYNEIIEQVTKYNEESLVPFQIVPIYDKLIHSSSSFDLTWNNSLSQNRNNSNKFSEYIILSRYPIINYNISALDTYSKIVVANININNYLISIYSFSLTEDQSSITNQDIRLTEVETINNLIKENSESIKDLNHIYKLIIKDTHILVGNLNISEYKQNILNNDYINILKELRAFDFGRGINEKEKKITNIYNERLNYILISIVSTIDTVNYKDYKEFALAVYNNQGVNGILEYSINTVKSNDNYPIEAIFLLSNKEKYI